ILERCPGIDGVHARGAPLPAFDVEAPLLSVAGILGTTLATIPAQVPYLSAEPERIEAWRRRLGADDAFRIGIAWQGSRDQAEDRYRSLPLRAFRPLACLPGVRLFSLQKGPGAEQVDLAAEEVPVIDLGPELDAGGGAFLDTAAVMKSLDLVVSADTSIAH